MVDTQGFLFHHIVVIDGLNVFKIKSLSIGPEK